MVPAMLAMIVAGLSTGQKAGIAVAGALFIAFSLLSSFLAPRFNPNFPGRQLRWYILVCVAAFVGMMSTIIFVAREPATEAAAAGNEQAGGQPTKTLPTTPGGNPTAGKAVFESAGCGACHTFAAAGSKGAVGPDLDKLQESATKANRGSLEAFTHESIVDPNAYVAPGFAKGIMPGNFGTTLKAQQIADLVAFLTQK
jgi:mono/diheme cytochrome c family protein